ncbi:disease resistance protein RGA4-like [Lolium perenne]|uniref:disease resistance protein RGA4-like n=1 Tax=Lolium perenne TaxID=4522 RepID=UPI0021EA829F|nr:disease resistance protein Pik-2-like [Lolium perenne]XP_051198531.1 disease resistance protein Pik-2-like [Lolium perenne]
MADLTVGLAKSVVEGTLSKAHAAIQEEAKLRQSAQRDLVFITGEFEMMRSFLNVANAERVENPVVRTWVRQIRELAYDVEDCIELVVHLDKDKTSFWFRLRRLCVPWAPARMPALDQAVDEIEQLKARVADVSTRNVRYSLISDTGSKPVVQQQLPAAATGGTVAAANMLAEARDAARRVQGLGGGDLTQLITKNVGAGLQVISVWGSGGDHGTASIIMKTYGDTEICSDFTYKAWVTLTHPFSPHDLVRSLMLQFCLEEEQSMDVPTMMQATQEVLFKNFQEIVTEKRYLVVVEDLSNMAVWHAFKKFLPDRRKGSWIIVSTQQPEIATLCVGHSYQILELKHFSTEHSVCALFNKGSFADGDNANKPVAEGSHSDGDKGKKPVVEESYSLVGRDSLIDQLRQYPAKARINSCQVMSVWGIAGVGKSALVKNLFDHTCYTGQFEKYNWVDVPHPFNLRDFHRSIPLDFRLETQSWLIVIDDIKSKQEWDLMQSSLLPRSSRSVIIIITTEASIAAYCSSGEELVLNVKGLEAAAASSLFEKVCRTTPSSSTVQEDTRVKELISKCGGLPKVIVAIADVLNKQTVTWMNTVVSLNERFMHHLERKPDYSLRDLFGWLNSYFSTCPDSLKPCIFYVSIFPRDHPIRRRRLVRRWIAEGYSRDGDDDSAEDRGEKQFCELLDLSIIHQVPHLATNTLIDTRMVLCQVNGFIREYIIPRRKEENLVFELGHNCVLATERTGRHLIILRDWNRDIIVFESMDFSRLRSLTVFGKWEPFLISENMKLLRVLDLEDADGLKFEDLENIVKWLHRLKFLSLRGQREIHHLPGNMDHLRQLQTLDVRGTSIVILPENITKLQKLQYIRAGSSDIPTTATPSALSWLPEFCRCSRVVGVVVPTGIRKLTALHTLGIVNVAASGGKTMVKALKKLTQLHKLGVSGINRKNIKDFSSAIKDHVNLESLSVHLDKDNQGCLDGIALPLGKLRSLKLYGLNESLPQGSDQLKMLRKLDLEMHTLSQSDIKLLGELPKLCILRLSVKQPSLNFISKHDASELFSYEKVKILEISCSSSLLSLEFGAKSMKTLELLKLDCSSGTPYDFTTSMVFLSELKEVSLIGIHGETCKTNLANKLCDYTKKPVLKVEELPRSS